MPERWQIPGERMERVLIDLLLGDRACVEGGEAAFEVTDAFERRVPPGFQFGGDQASVGIDPFVPTAGQLSVVTRLFDNANAAMAKPTTTPSIVASELIV
jgi:hypothetical protein